MANIFQVDFLLWGFQKLTLEDEGGNYSFIFVLSQCNFYSHNFPFPLPDITTLLIINMSCKGQLFCKHSRPLFSALRRKWASY